MSTRKINLFYLLENKEYRLYEFFASSVNIPLAYEKNEIFITRRIIMFYNAFLHKHVGTMFFVWLVEFITLKIKTTHVF